MRNGCVLCGSVGSGKSRTALAYYYTRVCGGSLKNDIPSKMTRPKNLYIITTARKRDTLEWEKEYTPFNLTNNKEVSIYKNLDIVVDSWNNIKKYVGVKDSFFIFDEQRVVGSGTWVKAFLKIARQNEWILLSATPGDTWVDYIPIFIANGFYKNRTEFLKRHAVINYYSKFPKIERYLDQGRLKKLKEMIVVQMDYTHEIQKHNEKIFVEYDRLKYKKLWANRWDEETKSPIENISKLCYLARKIVNADESRGEAILDLCKKHKKVIIFYNFDYELEILRSLKYESGTDISEWNGWKHEPIPKSDSWVYLVQYSAGAEGWNCIDTDTIIFYSQNYSYKTMVQSSGRIDRLNTPFSDLYYYHLRSSAPIDIAIERCLKKKQNFNEKSFVS